VLFGYSFQQVKKEGATEDDKESFSLEWALKIGRFEELSTKNERNVNKIQGGLFKKCVYE
jgi:hypothetical protein